MTTENDDEEVDERLENMFGQLFDMFLKFEQAFAKRAIDKINVSDEEAEAYAARFDKIAGESASAFSALLRYIPTERMLRRLSFACDAVHPHGLTGAVRLADVMSEFETTSLVMGQPRHGGAETVGGSP